MKNEKLLNAIGKIDDELIYNAVNDCGDKKAKRFPKRAKWSPAIAACLVLAIGLGFLLPRIGGNSAPGGNAGGSGHDDGGVFMSYAGPVLPLMLREDNAAITAQRNITMDFSSWVPSGDILVTDSYTLTNTDSREQTIRILYPFVSSLYSLPEHRPTLTVGGETLDTELHAGSYAGGFQGAWENWEETHENPGSLNLLYIESWEGYQTLLADGSYLQRALGEFVDLSHIPVVVYEFTDVWGPEENDGAGIPNPSIRVLFDIDYENTSVLSYGFHSGYYDSDTSTMGKGFSIREEWERGYGIPYYLIVIGDDIENVTYQGYATGGWDTKKKVEAGLTITRSESDLETVLRMAAGYYLSELDASYDFELYFGLMKEHLMGYGVLSDNCADRYDGGCIENLDVAHVSRVFWLEAEVTIPAGESVTLDTAFKKDPSYDYHCATTANKGISGYDLVTALGSNLTMTQQTARLEDCGQIEIVRQNFGFNLANGINKVTLDLNEPHYYLEVRKSQPNES